jgi:hypothetical protein
MSLENEYKDYKYISDSEKHLQEVNKVAQSLVGSKVTFGKTETTKQKWIYRLLSILIGFAIGSIFK